MKEMDPMRTDDETMQALELKVGDWKWLAEAMVDQALDGGLDPDARYEAAGVSLNLLARLEEVGIKSAAHLCEPQLMKIIHEEPLPAELL